MLILAAFLSIALLIGLAVAGPVLVLRAIFTSADNAYGRRRPPASRPVLPDVPV